MLNLPQELLLMVKEFIEPWDLRTHVCFYLSSSRVAALYDSSRHPDTFWELACWNNGLGFVEEPGENTGFPVFPDPGQLFWRRIAIDCITRDGFCAHPQCGERLLEYNRERMRCLTDEVEPLVPLSSDDYPNDHRVDGHRLFGHIAFHSSDNYFLPDLTVSCDAHLRAPDAPPRKIAYTDVDEGPDLEDYSGLYLVDHPLAAQSFATSIPVSSALILGLYGMSLPKGDIVLGRAITVIDVLSAIHDQLDEELSVSDVFWHIGMHESCIPENWPHRLLLRNLRTLRPALSLCPITRLYEEDRNDYGPVLSFKQL